MALSSVLGHLPVHRICVCACTSIYLFVYLFTYLFITRQKAVRMTIAREGTWDRADTSPFKI